MTTKQERMVPTIYTYEATVDRVIDGDTVFLLLKKTFVFDVDFGFRITDRVSLEKSTVMDFRLAGINAPELTAKDSQVRTAALAARDELSRLLQLGLLTVTTSKADKYGRWLAQISVKTDNAGVLDVNQAMVLGGFAVPYLV